jgi:hypothetical protein
VDNEYGKVRGIVISEKCNNGRGKEQILFEKSIK